MEKKLELKETRQLMKMLREGASDAEIFGRYCQNRLEKIALSYKKYDKEFTTLEAVKKYLLYQKIPKESIVQNGSALTVKLPNTDLKIYCWAFDCTLRYTTPCIFELHIRYTYSPAAIAEFIVDADNLILQFQADFEDVRHELEKKARKSFSAIRYSAQKEAKMQNISATSIESCVKNCLSSLGEVKFAHFKTFSHVYLYIGKQQFDIIIDYKNISERLKTLREDIDQLLALLEKGKITIRGNQTKKI